MSKKEYDDTNRSEFVFATRAVREGHLRTP